MSSYIREVITLQVGHYSNFIGTHWLNLQELNFVYDKSGITDINHDYFFREGLANNQECYVPRLLIVDAKGSLGSLPLCGSLYEDPTLTPTTSHALWSGEVDLINQIPEEKNEFRKALEREDAKYRENMDEDKDICSEDYSVENGENEQKIFDLSNKVNVWSDFLRPHLHPKTTFLLEDVLHQDVTGTAEQEGTEEVVSTWGFQEGVDIMRKEKTEEELIDRIRFLAESCDSLQGFQLLCDGHNGMGGVGASVAQHINDDYLSKDLFSFVSSPPYYKPRMSSDIALFYTNIIQSYTEIGKFSSMLLPLSSRTDMSLPASEVVRWPYISYKENCPYESSSLFAAFLDTVSIPWRTKSDPIPMNYIAHLLTPLQRKVVGGSFSIPIGLEEDAFLRDWLTEEETTEANNKMGLRSVGGNSDLKLLKDAEMSAIRGISQSKLESGSKRMKFENAWQMYEYFLKKTDNEMRRPIPRIVSGARDPLATGSPFPLIFSKEVGSKGYLKRSKESSPDIVSSAPAVGSIYNGKGIGLTLKDLWQTGKKINLAKIPNLKVGGLESDVWSSTIEEFNSILNCYTETNSVEYESD